MFMDAAFGHQAETRRIPLEPSREVLGAAASVQSVSERVGRGRTVSARESGSDGRERIEGDVSAREMTQLEKNADEAEVAAEMAHAEFLRAQKRLRIAQRDLELARQEQRSA